MQVKFESEAQKKFLHLSKALQIQTLRYIKRLENLENPRDMGKALSGNLKSYWRYRVGDYRLICKINDDDAVIIVADINHRSRIYKDFK